jgi:uncharacterized membrane protein
MMAAIRRKQVLLAFALIVAVAAVVGWRALHASDLLDIGTGYAAQQTCACRFVSGRTMESCMGDLDPLARKLISVRVSDGEVTASRLVWKATSRYEKGLGCTLRD